MKVGILGGTFDPVHNAHLNMALHAKEQFGLDEVWFMPSPNPPHKDSKDIADIKHRINMINLVISGQKGMKLCDYEAKQKDVCYTADTLTALASIYPDYKFSFIIGSDSLMTFEHWYKTDVILQYANILVAPRKEKNSMEQAYNSNSNNGSTSQSHISKIKEVIESYNNKYGNKFALIDLEELDYSSTEIRHKKNWSNSLPKGVIEYIKENNLYTDTINETWSLSDIEADIKATLSPKRFEHSMNVAQTAAQMAEAFNVNPNKAYLAGVLHDCAKELPDNELVDICKAHYSVTPLEERRPFLLHPKAGCYISQHKYKITDQEVLEAIKWHTTGKANMTDLEKIIFSADYIEPGRTKQPRLEYLREISTKDLDLLVSCILEDMVQYLKNDNDEIEEHTMEAYEYYCLNK